MEHRGISLFEKIFYSLLSLLAVVAFVLVFQLGTPSLPGLALKMTTLLATLSFLTFVTFEAARKQKNLWWYPETDGLAYARLARPLGLTLLEVDERGEFGAFADTLAARDRLLDPTTPATVAAVDAGDDGPPWLTLTLAAIVDTRRLAVILPAGAAPADVAVAGSAFAAVLAHHRGVAVCHSVG